MGNKKSNQLGKQRIHSCLVEGNLSIKKGGNILKKIILKIQLFVLLAYDKVRCLYKKDKLNVSKTFKVPFVNKGITIIFGWLEKDYWSLISFDLLDEDVGKQITTLKVKFLKLRLHIAVVQYGGKRK